MIYLTERACTRASSINVSSVFCDYSLLAVFVTAFAMGPLQIEASHFAHHVDTKFRPHMFS